MDIIKYICKKILLNLIFAKNYSNISFKKSVKFVFKNYLGI